MSQTFPWFILFLPLGAAVLITLFTHERRELSARLSIAAVVVSFWLSVLLFTDPRAADPGLTLSVNWLNVGGLSVDFGLLLDRLSLLMLLVVTAVAGAIHIYSYEYMRSDRSFSAYFAALSFFTFAMLGVVLSDNFLQMFMFWELVGVSSYLLIGFWHDRPAAADAGKKAFLTNRVGDAGFLAGIILLWAMLGSVNFDFLAQKLAEDPRRLGAFSTVAGLLIFCGAMAKSAQVPLHVWLPDAMEGPTPVSALIHAATMVAAGVFMLCRVFFLFGATPQWPAGLTWLDGISALEVIAWIGGITALMAAVIAIQQNDIKRILAYSTLSQLGYMVMAVGLGGRTSAMYHLTTHAFFKSLLFLGAGAVIYRLHHEQDIWRMGALRHKMPLTFGTFLLATLALCGVPPLSGYFSKDALLGRAYEQNVPLFLLGLFTAALTTFYMFRLIFVAFLGRPRSPHIEEVREVPGVMVLPMLFLAVPAALLGFWAVNHYLAEQFSSIPPEPVPPWYEQVFAPFQHLPLVAFLGLGAIACGFFAAWGIYGKASKDPLPEKLGGLARAMRNRFYFDELYARIIAVTQELLADFADWFDRWILAGVGVRGAHGTTEFFARLLRLVQTGNLRTYAILFGAGVVILLYALLTR
ncbi:MAG: NADH-quinone oxidoreductase subunit L [Candidatus Omnitrophica bacterium]|nr:NADH-quinone oxidoreductase subunit L [Candidatus Omnitrophota bacterium]